MVVVLVLAFLACIPAANWLIGNVGTVCNPGAPCLIPVAPGLMAPSGVLMIGAALALRDALHETVPRWAVAGLIAAGAALSLAVSPPALAVASAAAFLFSELADFAVYDRLRARGMTLAVLASGVVGAALDSVLFNALAFGTVKWAPGTILAKLYASAAYAIWLRGRAARLAIASSNAPTAGGGPSPDGAAMLTEHPSPCSGSNARGAGVKVEPPRG